MKVQTYLQHVENVVETNGDCVRQTVHLEHVCEEEDVDRQLTHEEGHNDGANQFDGFLADT